jgi:hypothetical protein
MPETPPTSIRLSDQERAWLDRYGQGVTGQLREDLGLLEHLIDIGRREIAGKFTMGEASLITDAFNGCVFEPRMPTKAVLQMEIEDAIKLNQLHTKWDVSQEEILYKLQEISDLGALAVIHSTRLFWAASAKETVSTDDLIRRTWPGM